MRISTLPSLVFILALSCLAAFSARAESVSRQKASAAAQAFWSAPQTKSPASGLEFAWDSRALAAKAGTAAQASAEEPLFHVFSGTGGKGFVIVAGEDSVMPVLAYSFDEPAPSPDRLPDGLLFWLDWISRQIENIRLLGYEDADMAAAWNSTQDVGNVVVEMETAPWHQDDPYNRECPLIDGQRAAVGCVALAIGTVMRYHKWPAQGTGTSEAYVTYDGLSIDERDLSHEYDWDKMPLYNASETGYTTEEATQVSTLLSDIGHALALSYGVDATGGLIHVEELYAHFNYNPDMTDLFRNGVSDELWLSMIEEDLDNGLPLLYGGVDSQGGGHQFILDGYTDAGYYHVNWGWGGRFNGYFSMSTLGPDENSAHSYDQDACFRFKPNTSDNPELEHWLIAYDYGLVCSKETFSTNEAFVIDGIQLANLSAMKFDGIIRAALCDRTGERKEWISDPCSLEDGISPNRANVLTNISCTITGPIEPGDRIRFFYQGSGSENWYLIGAYHADVPWEVVVKQETLENSTSFSFNAGSGIVTLSTVAGVEYSVNLDGTAVLSGTADAEGIVTIDTSALGEDTYTLTLSLGEDVKTLEFAVQPL